MADGKPASIKEVARLAGVSEQTVSRTVHDSPAVRPATKEKVRRAIAELGYRPSNAGRALRRGCYMALGIVMGNISETGNRDRLEMFVDAAAAQGYTIALLKMDREEPLSLGQAADRMSSLSIDGMIYVLNRTPEDFDTFVPRAGLPEVIISMHDHPACPTVDSDQEASAHAVVDYLVERGHTKIWHIGGPSRSLAGLARESGWRSAMLDHGIEPPQVIAGDWSPESGYAAGVLLADKVRSGACTAVFASDDAMAYGCMCALSDAGLSVPGDVSMIGADDISSAFVPNCQLTSLHFDNSAIAEWAIGKLVIPERMADGCNHKLFPGHLVERGSVRTLR